MAGSLDDFRGFSRIFCTISISSELIWFFFFDCRHHHILVPGKWPLNLALHEPKLLRRRNTTLSIKCYDKIDDSENVYPSNIMDKLDESIQRIWTRSCFFRTYCHISDALNSKNKNGQLLSKISTKLHFKTATWTSLFILIFFRFDFFCSGPKFLNKLFVFATTTNFGFYFAQNAWFLSRIPLFWRSSFFFICICRGSRWILLVRWNCTKCVDIEFSVCWAFACMMWFCILACIIQRIGTGHCCSELPSF